MIRTSVSAEEFSLSALKSSLLLAASAAAMIAYIGCGMLLGLINMRDVWKALRIGKRMAK